MYIIFLGAPGAGKGTQAAIVAQEFGLVHIASGDLFRQAVERGDELGLKVKAYMEEGVLVPDEVTIQMVLERMSAPDCSRWVILDGFPRNREQARALDKALARQNKAIDRVLHVRVSGEELIKRLGGRRTCRDCQMPYHIESSPPRVWNKCDQCGGELYQRPDDTARLVGKRLKVYFAGAASLIGYYTQMGKLSEVNGEGSVAEVTGRIVAVLREEELQLK